MTTSKKNKKKTLKTRKKNTERELSRALYDLSSIFTRKEIADKFKITERQVSVYRKYRIRKPFNKEKKGKILNFYNKLQKAKEGEDLFYHYIVTGKQRRIKPSIQIPSLIIDELAERIGVINLARRMGVSRQTIWRWRKGKFLRLSLRTKEKLHKLSISVTKKLLGLFFLQEEFVIRSKKTIKKRRYSVIRYLKVFLGTEEEFKNYINAKEYYELVDSIIGEKGKFKKEETINFMVYLKEVKKSGDSALLSTSAQAYKEFIIDNFRGKEPSILLGELNKIHKID